MRVRAYTCRDAYVGVRGQLAGVRSLCLPCGSQVIRLGEKHFYLLSHAIEFLLPVSLPEREERKREEGKQAGKAGRKRPNTCIQQWLWLLPGSLCFIK